MWGATTWEEIVHKSVAEAISVLANLPVSDHHAGTESSAHSDSSSILYHVAAGLDAAGSSSIESFNVIDDAGATRLVPVSAEMPGDLTLLANKLWGLIGGKENKELAGLVLDCATREFARSQFHSIISWLAYLKDPAYLLKNDAPRIERMLLETPWGDAGRLARRPERVWASDFAAQNFDDWLWGFRGSDGKWQDFHERSPKGNLHRAIRSEDLLYAVSLVWLDEAIQDPRNALSLMAEAADAQDHAGRLMGWDMHEEYLQLAAEDGKPKTVAALARHAANARHSSNRVRAERLRAAYLAGAFKSKDSAAEKLASQFGLSFRAAREHLKGI